MRRGAFVFAAAVGLAAAAPAHADEWTLIDVRAHLANDGRVTVVETHHIVLDTTGRSVYHEFARGADQDVRLTAVTRIGPDGEPHRLKRVENVTGPDEYAYYELGHAHYAIPDLGEHVALQYRFEYELIGAVAPAWAIAAGAASRAPGEQALIAPWRRAREVYDDWRRAWPALGTRYRFDHDVLLPDRPSVNQVFRQIDYRLEYGSAWRDIAPQTDIGAPAGGAFRTARVFDYLGPGQPAYATTQAATLRILSLLLPPVIGVVGFGLVVAASRLRRGPPVDRTFVDTRFLSRAPEEIAFWTENRRPPLGAMLSRLAAEGAISIHVDRPTGHTFEGDDPDALRLHMRRVAADAALTSFERDVLADLFGPERELTNASHYARHAGTDYLASAVIGRHLREAHEVPAPGTVPIGGGKAAAPKTRTSLARVGLFLVFAGALFGVLKNLGPVFDVVPVVGIWIFFTAMLVNSWPTAWWYSGRPVRGLAVALLLLYAMQVSVLLIPNRPLPAEGWLASAIAVLAGYFLTLVRSQQPGGDGGVIGDLQRMRLFAADELKRPRPQLDDRWIPRLRALGLGTAIDAWRARYGGAGAMPPQMGDRPLITNATFTGREPAPWTGPRGWDYALDVYGDDGEDEDEDEHDEDGHDEDGHDEDGHDEDGHDEDEEGHVADAAGAGSDTGTTPGGGARS